VTEQERMAHVDDIEKAAINCGFKTRRIQVRSLTAIQILWNGLWTHFDPVSKGKDTAKLLFGVCRNAGMCKDESEFRLTILKEAANGNAIQKKR